MIFAASIPSISPWITMSIRIRSGRSRPAISIASSPDSAVPTTSQPNRDQTFGDVLGDDPLIVDYEYFS